MVYGTYNYSYWGESKPTNITGGGHIGYVFDVSWAILAWRAYPWWVAAAPEPVFGDGEQDPNLTMCPPQWSKLV